MSNVVPLKKHHVEPLVIEFGKNHPSQGSAFLQFNRGLTDEEWQFFLETCQRTAFLMRGLPTN